MCGPVPSGTSVAAGHKLPGGVVNHRVSQKGGEKDGVLAWLSSFYSTRGFVEGGPNDQLKDRTVVPKRELYKRSLYRRINPYQIATDSLLWLPRLAIAIATAAVVSGQGLLVLVVLDQWLGWGITTPDPSGEFEWPVFLKLMTFSSMGAVVMYHVSAGHLYRKYYIKQRANAHEWKIQPDVWPSRAVVQGQARLGTLNTWLGSLMSCYYAYNIMRFGFEKSGTKLYGTVAEAGGPVPILTVFFQFVLVMAWDDAFAYYMHRFLHVPFMYKHCHKWHHLYKAPTPYASMALHPLEFFLFTLIPFQTAFIFRQHAGVYLFHLCWILYYTVEDHSGIMRTSMWPWQQDSTFHDDHHKHFHVNFGMTTYYWDWLHGTIRDPKCKYDETTFVNSSNYHKKETKEK